jgi:hypothetical protein
VSEIIGVRGTISVATRGSAGPGEVMLRYRGGTEAYVAYSEEPIPRGMTVVVYDHRGGRVVDVSPLGVQPTEEE